MEEKNELSLDQLKEIYKAQTEAYLDFNLALINILSNQKDLLSKIENLHGLSDAEFKNLIKGEYKLYALSECGTCDDVYDTISVTVNVLNNFSLK